MGDSSGIWAKVCGITPSRPQIEKKKKSLRSKRQQWESLRRWTLLLSDHKESETLPSKEGFQYLDPSCEVTEGLGLLRYLEFGDLGYKPRHGEERQQVSSLSLELTSEESWVYSECETVLNHKPSVQVKQHWADNETKGCLFLFAKTFCLICKKISWTIF